MSEIQDWRVIAIRKINDLRNLPVDWDGYGSQQIEQRAIDTAVSVVLKLPKDLSAPHVAPVPGGGIQLEWQSGTEVEILPNGSMELLVSLKLDQY